MNIRKAIAFTFRGRAWVMTIALLQVAVVLIVGYHSFRVTERACLYEFNQRQLVMAHEATDGIVLYFETVAGALKALARVPEIHQLDEISARQALALEMHELEPLGVNDIAVLDANGVLRFNVAAPQIEGQDFSWRRYFQEAKEMTSSETYVIQFIEFKGVEAGQKGVLVGVPMFEIEAHSDKHYPSPSGTFAGVVVCTLKLDALTQQFIAPIKPSERGHAFLIDDQYNILWAPDSSLFGKNLSKEVENFPSFQQILERMSTGDSGTAECSFYRFDESHGRYTKDTGERLLAYAPVHLGKKLWALGVWAPKEAAKPLIQSAYLKQVLPVTIIIMIILLGPAYSLTMAFRYSTRLETAVEAKTKEFKESHQRLLTVLHSLDAVVYVADMDTYEILFVNKYTQDIFGDVVGKMCWQVLQTAQSGPCSFCTNEKLLGPDGKPTGVNVWESRNTLTGKWFENRDRAIPWVDGRIVRLEIATDINDRKQAEEDLKRAHNEMGTFCRILKQVGSRRTLDGVSSFLMKELQIIVNSKYMVLYVFNADRSILFALSDRGTSTVEDPELVQTASTILGDLGGLTIAPHRPFKPPLVPDYFPTKGRQTIIPLRTRNQLEGAFVIACEPDCLCDEKGLEMIALVLDQVSGTIKRAVLHEEELHDLKSRVEITSEFFGIIGKDPKMLVIYGLIDDIAPTDASVLIQGETGTGKELVARAIHHQSLRKDKPFVVINCSAYPSTLLESELFGHERGAFTGAIRKKTGRFEQAHGGTVFLDEIGEIPASAQIKLLRVLQTQQFERLGGEQTLDVDVRIVAATNKDLLQEVKNDHFREDLFYRLNVIPVLLPQLRKRRNDIPLLARHFLRRFASEQDKHIQGFSSAAMRLFLDYPWPGNVRELENSIEHCVVLAKGYRIEVSDLPAVLRDAHSSSSAWSHQTILQQERILVQQTLEECNWNKKETAQRLGISRSTLYEKLRKHHILKPSVH